MIETSYKIRKLEGNMAGLADMLKKLGAEQKWSDRCVYQVTLVLDEIVSNILQYGYSPSEAYDIDVAVKISGQRVRLEVRDTARQFNPIEDVSGPEMDKPLLERKRCVGGMGLYFVKSFMNSLCYRYENGQNILVMERELSSLCDAEKCRIPEQRQEQQGGEQQWKSK